MTSPSEEPVQQDGASTDATVASEEHDQASSEELKPVREPKDFYALSLSTSPLGGLVCGLLLGSGFILPIQAIVGAAGAACALLACVGIYRWRCGRFLDRVSDALEAASTLDHSTYLELWRWVQRSADNRWLLANDDHLFDILELVAQKGTPPMPIRVRSALKLYARQEVRTAIDKSFKNLEDLARDERKQANRQRWIALAAIILAVVAGGMGCLASYGIVPVLPTDGVHPPRLVKDPTLTSSWTGTAASLGLAVILLTVAGIALRTLERHLTRALLFSEKMRFASGLKASCALDLHPFLAKFAPASVQEMLRLTRDPRTYDLISLSELMEKPKQETLSLGGAAAAFKDLSLK